jgi:transposase-like protein
MARRKRRSNFSPEQKSAIVRQHLLEQVPISDLCDQHGIQPSQFYTWQKQLFENAAKAFEPGRNEGRERELSRKIEVLQATVRTKDEIIAEVTEAFVREKKARGGA